MLLPYQSPVNFRSEKVGGNFQAPSELPLLLSLSSPELPLLLSLSSPEFILLIEGLLKEETVEFSNCLLIGNIYGKTMAGNVAISEVDALPCVVVSRAEKHVPYGELVRNTERITL